MKLLTESALIRKGLQKQLSRQQRSAPVSRIIDLAEKSFRYVVNPGVMDPFVTDSAYVARWLASHPEIYHHKRALELCAGIGIFGITMSLFGASSVLLADNELIAIKNGQMIIRENNLREIKYIESDLFEKVTGKFDVIIASYPFFEGNAGNNPLERAMISDSGFIDRLLTDSKAYLSPCGELILPYLSDAGKMNDPRIAGPRNGFLVKDAVVVPDPAGIWEKDLTIVRLTHEASHFDN
jgi:methylase of polypeptide subunit release factors